MVPFCVNPTTGQWYGEHMNPVATPPSHAHIKPPPPVMPTDVTEYHIPSIDLPDQWKYAIDTQGRIYYYHTKILIPQWDPPIKLLPLMEEQRLTDIDIKYDSIGSSMSSSSSTSSIASLNDDEFDGKNDSDDEDEDVVNILSNSKMNAKRLLQLKSDPILEKYIDDDSSSTSSEDSETQELERQLSFLKRKTEEYWGKL